MHGDFTPALALLGLALLIAGAVLAVARVVSVSRTALQPEPFVSGHAASEHGVSRFHVRWYAIAMVFLAFDMEMLFMYPWTLVVRSVGTPAVVEMFLFLAVLFAGVLYAWREGAFRWT